MRHSSVCCLFAVVSLLAPAAGGAELEAEGYRLTPLGVLPAPFNEAGFPKAINNLGQVLIDSGQQPNLRPAIYDPATRSLTNLGTLPAPYNAWAEGSGLNDRGLAVGTASGGGSYHAFLSFRGSMTDLGTLPRYRYASQANGINISNQVVGASAAGVGEGDTAHAFLYTGGSMLDLGSLPGFASSVAWGINDSGLAVGTAFAAFGPFQPTMAFVGGLTGLRPLQTLPAPFNFGSAAYAINHLGQVVGAAYDSAGHSHAVLWSDGRANDLGTLPGFGARSEAKWINDRGQIMGYSVDENGGSHDFLYADGKFTDLNDLLYRAFDGWQLVSFGPINDLGQIGAAGYAPDGTFQPVLLTPVPEPAGALLIAVGAAALLRRPGRRRRGRNGDGD